MSQRLTAYANMLEASVRTPQQSPGSLPTQEEADRRLRVVTLLRALTPDEAAALLRDKQFPERLAALAEVAGLPVEECMRGLAGAAWRLTEGLRPSPDSGRPEG
jgi:hypothetical protein